MLIQLFEFYYWLDVMWQGSPNFWAILLFVLEIAVFAYCVHFWIYKTFPFKLFFQVVFWIDLIISSALFIYTCVLAYASWSDWGPLILIISIVFLGSDIFMCFGILFLMKNYIPV